MFLSIALLALINVTTQKTEIYLIYVPPAINVVMTYVTGQNNQYSNLLVFYLIVIICISLYFKLSLKPKDLMNITQILVKREEIEATPMHVEKKIETHPQSPQEETYVDDNYYNALETELEELTLDDINEILGETPTEETSEPTDGDSDLIDEILNEIELKKK